MLPLRATVRTLRPHGPAEGSSGQLSGAESQQGSALPARAAVRHGHLRRQPDHDSTALTGRCLSALQQQASLGVINAQ